MWCEEIDKVVWHRSSIIYQWIYVVLSTAEIGSIEVQMSLPLRTNTQNHSTEQRLIRPPIGSTRMELGHFYNWIAQIAQPANIWRECRWKYVKNCVRHVSILFDLNCPIFMQRGQHFPDRHLSKSLSPYVPFFLLLRIAAGCSCTHFNEQFSRIVPAGKKSSKVRARPPTQDRIH